MTTTASDEEEVKEYGSDFNDVKDILSNMGMDRLLNVIASSWQTDETSALKQALVSAAQSFQQSQTDMLSKNWGEHEERYSCSHYCLNFKDGKIVFPHPTSDEETADFSTSDGVWTREGTYEFKLGYRTYCRKCDSHDAAAAVYAVSIVDEEGGVAKEIRVRGEADCGMSYCSGCKPLFICDKTVKFPTETTQGDGEQSSPPKKVKVDKDSGDEEEDDNDDDDSNN